MPIERLAGSSPKGPFDAIGPGRLTTGKREVDAFLARHFDDRDEQRLSGSIRSAV